SGAADAVGLLLSRGARVDATDHYGVTPLMLACGAERPEACKRLLEARASVTAADRAGNTAYVYAARSARTQQTKDLLAAGAVPVRVAVVTAAAATGGPLLRAPNDAYAGWPDVVVAA